MKLYDFTNRGIKKMRRDCLKMFWAALEDKCPNFDITELDINIAIGDRKIIVPLHADSLDLLFDYMEKVNGDY